MVNTIGRVDFTARIDGRRTPRDAEKIGRQAGEASAEGYDETWSKGFRESLDKNAKAAFDRWKKSGKQDGTVYGGTFNRTFTPYIKRAQRTFDQLRVNPNFLGDLKAQFNDAGLAAAEVQKHLVDLNREGEISDRVFAGARRQVDEWATSQRNSAEATNRQSESMSRLNTWLERQRAEFEKNQSAIAAHSRSLEENEKAFDFEKRQRHLRLIQETRQRILENVEVHTRNTDALRRHIAQVGDADLVYRRFGAYLEQYRAAVGGTDRTYINLSNSIDKVTNSMDKNTESSKKMNGSWSSIPHNGRQIILIAAAIAGGMQQIAVLGSAAGAGLLVFGAAASGVVVGIGSMVTAFIGLGGELDKLPESVRPAAQAFQDLKGPLEGIQDILQERAFADAAPVFRSLGDTIKALTPSFGVMGDAIGRIVAGFAAWAASETGIRLVSGLIEKSAGIFEKFVSVSGKLGEALLEIFNNPAIQKGIDDMLTGIGGLFDDLNQYVKTEEFTEWIESSGKILGELGELVGAVSQVFNDLVTPEAQERTSAFLQSLTDAMPGLSEFLDIFSELDIFGVIAVGLNELLNGLKPLWDLLSPIASIVGDLLVGSFQNLHFWILLLTPALEVLRLIFEVLASALSKWLEYVTPFQEAFQTLSDALSRAGDIIWEHLKPAFDLLWDAIIQLLPTADEFTRWINDVAVPAIEDFAHWMGTEGAQAIEDFAAWLRDEAVPQAKKFWEVLSTKVIPFLVSLITWLISAGTTFSNWARGVKTALEWLTAPLRYAIDLFNQLFGAATSANGAVATGKSMGNGVGSVPGFASGGMLGGPRYILAGEDGPEAIVPLRRALDRVDPSVRWLSAIAQGKTPTAASGGISGGGGRAVSVEAGAIVVQEASSGLATSVEVLDRLAAKLA